MNNNNVVYQFKITLHEITPPIWRRIQVPIKYSFWDLHVAIQDSMGWLDYHLHAFRFRPKHKRKSIEVGIPVDDWGGEKVIPGWEVPIVEHFTDVGQIIQYEYDFGDGWSHEILFEGILLKTKGTKYPKCIDGERACPPEDCGSVDGYYRLIEILKDPKNSEYQENVEWLKGHAKNYWPYEPDNFIPSKVCFENPKKRWKIAFAQK
ncbi:plasmid pRiA4b ORF-3 family protein [bacterium]|nr:plasmid pRiA4b ORF-3 family protein [bacterium]